MFYHEIHVKTTAYTIGDGHTPSTRCADGTVPKEGAVAYNGVPFGTVIFIDNKKYTVHDRSLYDGTVDIYMDSIEDCLNYGVRYKKVLVLK